MQQTDIPVVAFPFILFSMGIIGLLALSARYWLQGLNLWSSGQPVLPVPEPRRIQPWGFVDLIFAFLVVLGLQMIAALTGALLHIGPPVSAQDELGLGMLTWISTVQTSAVAMVSAFIAVRCGVRFSSIGWSLARLPYDIWLGFKTFIVIAPPVYLLMMVVTGLSGQEYKHPIHELASQDPWMLLPAIFMAVVLAPLGEEFAFRVLLQGFLESLSMGRLTLEKFLVGPTFDKNAQATASHEAGSSNVDDDSTGTLLSSHENPYATGKEATPLLASDDHREFGFRPLPREEVAMTDGVEVENGATRLPSPAWWPLLISGLLFGLAHFEYGMSWIPLTVLGIALGWLYRITNRIWPSLVVHLCINATSMIGFSLTVLYGDPTDAIP